MSATFRTLPPRSMRRRHLLVAAALAATLTQAAMAQTSDPGFASHPTLEPMAARVVLPAANAVRFRQTQFVFRAGRMLDSDWGRIDVNKEAVRKALGPEGGYINVALFTPGHSTPAWVVENLRIVPDGAAARDGIGRAALASEGLGAAPIVVPMVAHFDLRPAVRGTGRINAVYAAVVASPAPLPAVDRVFNVLRQLPPAAFEVTSVVEDAEGAEPGATKPSPTVMLQLGDPPQPVQPHPEPPSGFAYATEIYQYEMPNIQTSKNQCMPMAMANVVGYLRLRYNKPPLAWPLPHQSSPGIGMTMSAGDVIFWQPEPTVSRIAQIDARTRRTGVYDFETGSGASVCEMMRATFNYFATQGVPGMVSFAHQDSAALIGAGGACDNADPTLPQGGYSSVRQGQTATWDWFYDQLQAGRGVMIMFGRYDTAGKRTGGHAVRVWGARRFNGRDYLYTLDDGDQGLNNAGLRTEQWEVADQSQPGVVGMPNGRLELGAKSWEIEIAVAMQAHPTLLVP
jgi:hypothetical protein